MEVIKRSGIDIAPTYDEYTASAFYIAKKAGVNIDEVRLKRAEERQRQMEKEQEQRGGNVQMCKCALLNFSTRVRAYIIM